MCGENSQKHKNLQIFATEKKKKQNKDQIDPRAEKENRIQNIWTYIMW